MSALSTGRVTIRHLMPDEAEAHDNAVEKWPGAMIYASRRFAGFLEEVAHCRITHLVAERDGRLVGSLPFAVKTDHRLGSVVNSLPWFGSHGGCWLREPEDCAARDALLAAYESELRSCDPLFSVTILSHSDEAHAARYRHFLGQEGVDQRIGQLLELPASPMDCEETLLGLLSRRTRNHVRKSLKQGFEERIDDNDAAWRYLYETHCTNIRALSGKPKPRNHFDALRRRFTGGAARLSLACLDGEPVAGLLLLTYGRVAEYLVPAITIENRSLQPLSFLIWNAVLECTRKGYRVWNWGGTWRSQVSLHHFKAGWGSRDHLYSYLVRARSDALARFLQAPHGLMDAFPYFYLYPLNRLHERDTTQ